MGATRIDRAAMIVLAMTSILLVIFVLRVTADLPAPAVLDPDWSWAIEAGASISLALRAFSGRGERAAWLALAFGCASFCGGDVYYTFVLQNQDVVPTPSPADGLYLGFYLACLIALGLLVRSRAGRFSPIIWLDAMIGSLSVAAFGAALVLPAVLASTGGAWATIATNLVYPLADLLLLAVAVGAIALMGWRPGRGFAMIATTLCLFAITDTIYLYQTAVGTYRADTLLDVGWAVALVLLAISGWQPLRRMPRLMDGWATLVAPLLLGFCSLGMTIYDHFARVDTFALLLASGALGAVLLRLGVTFAEHLRMLADSREEASTDPLTGLGNRRALMRDLERSAAAAGPTAPVLLAVFDLDGFKNYNDRFGHPAGDLLLRRLALRLLAAAGQGGSAYRMGGDEFCLLCVGEAESFPAILSRARRALREHGDEFDVDSSHGAVELAAEGGSDPETALREADRRLYVDKNGGRGSASRQSSAVLLRALEAHSPVISHSLDRVAALAALVARSLGLSEDGVDEIERAAELHDIGKVGIPAAILQKPERLTSEERAYMRRHTLIGQRILDAAPALATTGRLVRSSHEHWDGSGYPDGLAGEEIPLGARIILACDAYDAMSIDRPYQAAVSHEQAVAELVRCAGTQFDPAVIAALCAAVVPERQVPVTS